MTYTKPWKDYDEQLDKLMADGLGVSDRAQALDWLKRIGYYRLSGYWYPFRLPAAPPPPPHPRFRAGATFRNAVELYIFDKKLRLLVLDALERIEIAVRVDIAHTLGRLDPFAYLRPDLFHATFGVELDAHSGLTAHHVWLGKHAGLIKRSKEEFVRHNKMKYGLPLAIWVACEVWDFGTLSHLFGGMRVAEQDAVAARYGVANGRVFASWLRSLNYLRNVCAHHSRLWNRNIVDQARLPPATEHAWVAPFLASTTPGTSNPLQSKCFVLLMIIRHLMDIIHSGSGWKAEMKSHLLDFPDLSHLSLGLGGMGAPPNWTTDW